MLFSSDFSQNTCIFIIFLAACRSYLGFFWNICTSVVIEQPLIGKIDMKSAYQTIEDIHVLNFGSPILLECYVKFIKIDFEIGMI